MSDKTVKVVDGLNQLIGRIVSFGFIPLTAICIFEVVMRYVFNRPTIWAWDLDQELFCFITLMGAGYTLKEKAHVRVDVVVDRFSQKRKDLVEVITRCVFIVATIMLLHQTGRMAVDSLLSKETSSTFWTHPLYPVKIFIVIGIFLLLIQAITSFIIAYDKLKKGNQRLG